MNKYHSLLEHIDDGIVIIQDNQIRLANSAMASLTGYRKKELVGMSFEQFLTPSSDSSQTAVYETRVRTRAGVLRPVRVSVAPTEFQGRPADEMIIRDITCVKAQEDALREIRGRYLLLSDNVNDILFELDESGCFEYVSPTVEKITQYPVNEVLGQHFSQFIHQEDINGLQFGFEYTIEGQIEPQPFRVKTKSGEWVYLRCYSHVRKKHGHAAGVSGVLTDVTKHKQVEEALRNREEYFRALTENASDVILALKEDGHIQYASPAVKNVTGYLSSEITGQDFFTHIYPGDSLKAARLFIYTCTNPEYTGNGELRLNHKDGSMHYVEVIGKNALENPAVKGIILNLHDITEHKLAEQRERDLEQDLHIASRLASIGQLAAGVAHEINNPLTSIIGFSQLLARKEFTEDVKDKINIINSEAQRVARIVQGLLTFAHQDEFQRGQTDINEILAQILKLRSYAMSEHNIQITRSLDTNLPPVTGDAAQLQQVFLNIVLNAEKEMYAAHGRGHLLIKTETLFGGIRISFTDDGPGISPENMSRLFTPFFTTHEVGEGTGLGLSICHGIVTRHGGKVYAQSKFGEGATFFVDLPVDVESESIGLVTAGDSHTIVQPAAQPATESPAKARPTASILVIDDDTDVLQKLQKTLSEAGHQVDTAEKASQAAMKMGVRHYDVILLDIQMPSMSGMDLYTRVQGIDPDLIRSLIFIVGEAADPVVQSFLDVTRSEFITRPFQTEDVLSSIERVLESKAEAVNASSASAGRSSR